MMIETDCKILKHLYSKSARDLIEILPGKPSHVCIANVSTEPVRLPKFLLVEDF